VIIWQTARIDDSVRIGKTETPVNSPHLDWLCEFHRSLGIPDEDHFVRPLAKRGYSREGLELDMSNLLPEVTANLDGIFWHPLSTDADMQVSRSLFPLAESPGGLAQLSNMLKVYIADNITETDMAP
jgi:hypothetical protein